MTTRYLDLGNPVNTAHPSNRGRIAWWVGLPNNSGGTRLHNVIPGGQTHGTLTNGPTWVGGPSVLTALRFAVASPPQNISLGTFAPTGTSRSFVFRIRSAAAATTLRYLFDSAAGRHIIAWNATTSGTLGLFDNVAWREFGLAPNDGLWHTVVYVCDAVAGLCRAYVDGVQSGIDRTYSSVSIGGATRLCSHNAGDAINDGAFRGDVASVVLYNRILSPTEVSLDYRDPSGQLRWVTPRTYSTPPVAPVTSVFVPLAGPIGLSL